MSTIQSDVRGILTLAFPNYKIHHFKSEVLLNDMWRLWIRKKGTHNNVGYALYDFREGHYVYIPEFELLIQLLAVENIFTRSFTDIDNNSELYETNIRRIIDIITDV